MVKSEDGKQLPWWPTLVLLWREALIAALRCLRGALRFLKGALPSSGAFRSPEREFTSSLLSGTSHGHRWGGRFLPSPLLRWAFLWLWGDVWGVVLKYWAISQFWACALSLGGYWSLIRTTSWSLERTELWRHWRYRDQALRSLLYLHLYWHLQNAYR